MLTSALEANFGFDADTFEQAFTAADFDRCRLLLVGDQSFDAAIASARLALRERRYGEIIGSLAEVPGVSDRARTARDVLLGAALGFTRDFAGGSRLIERALANLAPQQVWYYEALHHRALINWMRKDHRAAERDAMAELESNDRNHRARARILLSWIAVGRGEVLRQVDELQKALDEVESAEPPDEYYRANALFALTILCRELPLSEVADRMRAVAKELPWTTGLRLEHFHVTRLLAAIDELDGNELAAFAGFKKAARLAPSEHWNVLCYLHRAELARNTGEVAFATEQLQEAHELAQRLSWNDVVGEERAALLLLAELFAYDEPAIAEQYLARFRTMRQVIPILAYATDARVTGFEAYSRGVAWDRLGDMSEGQAALMEAWSIFEDFNYAWRAALCALSLHGITHDRRWLDRAAKRIEPWPHSWIARRVAESAKTSVLRLDRIPPAKRQVLELVRAGQRNSEIAKALGRSPNTVRNQLSDLFQTFNVRSRAELVAALSRPVVPVTELSQRRRRG